MTFSSSYKGFPVSSGTGSSIQKSAPISLVVSSTFTPDQRHFLSLGRIKNHAVRIPESSCLSSACMCTW